MSQLAGCFGQRWNYFFLSAAFERGGASFPGGIGEEFEEGYCGLQGGFVVEVRNLDFPGRLLFMLEKAARFECHFISIYTNIRMDAKIERQLRENFKDLSCFGVLSERSGGQEL